MEMNDGDRKRRGCAQEEEVSMAEMAGEHGANNVRAGWGVLENKSIEK